MGSKRVDPKLPHLVSREGFHVVLQAMKRPKLTLADSLREGYEVGVLGGPDTNVHRTEGQRGRLHSKTLEV